jgi:O-antigen/teichoic acid export membrane protein
VVSSLHVTVVIATAVAAGIAVTSSILVPTLYGSGFAPAVLPLQLLLLGSVLYACASVLISGLNALNRPFNGGGAQMLGAAVTAVGLFIVLPQGGIVGAAAVSSVAYSVVFGTSLLLFKRSAQMTWRDFVSRPDLATPMGQLRDVAWER